ncbi:MAG: S-layer homology domain-containing protein [Clostridia bacterium]|nr:S-layer homology domain-containing protein [Clostridia bacterium]
MKKKLIFSTFLCAVICVSLMLSVFAVSFSDLTSSYWAYSNIIELSSKGVINGYSDGTFRPEAHVTRAEFVKLIGTINVTKGEDFADLPKSHWAYSYVMNSGVDMDRKNFRPDENITRAEVLDILWNRYGIKTDAKVPGLIENQHKNVEAVAWAYSYGLMIGDDGINLRLEDDLSRAEAVTLILRSRKVDTSKQKLLADNVDSIVLENIFNRAMLFDKKYNENDTVTVGEISRAALRLAYQTQQIPYNKDLYIGVPAFESEYANDIAHMAKQVFGEENNNKEFAESKANQQQAIAALMYGYMFKANESPVIGRMDDYYKDATVERSKTMLNMLLTYTNRRGVFASADGLLHNDKAITHKEIASLILQLDSLTGSQISYSNGKEQDEKLSTDAYLYKEADKDFGILLKELPAVVYKTPIEGSASEFTVFSKDFFEIFTTLADGIQGKAKSRATEIVLRVYPTLISNAGDEVVMRTKIYVASNPKGLGLGEIIGKCDMNTDVAAKEGTTYIIDISTNQPLNDMYINPDDVSLRRLIWND